MFFWHVLPGVRSYWLVRCLADQQQPERECLCKSSREQNIEVNCWISGCLRVCIKNISKFLPYLQQWMTLFSLFVEFGQPITHDSTNKPRGMCH